MLSFSLVCGMNTVCRGLFALSLCAHGKPCFVIVACLGHPVYHRRTSMDQTSLEPWKFVLDMGSSFVLDIGSSSH